VIGLGGRLASRSVVRLAQIAVGVLMGWAALAKLGDVASLAREIHNFRIVPVPVENLLAMVLPWVELTAALSLLLGIRARAGAVVSAGLLAVFTAAVALAVARGLNVECGCFGTGGSMRTGGAKLVANLGILALVFLAMAEPRGGDGEFTAATEAA